ncbi:MAG: hypothetical protein ACI9HA_002350, partial [Dinoroseobacter sp.]
MLVVVDLRGRTLRDLCVCVKCNIWDVHLGYRNIGHERQEMGDRG